MESEKLNEGELTSTMGNLLSVNKDEKTETSDSTPTSSTDAFTTTSTSQIVADDPISSTSSDALDSGKNTETISDVSQSSTSNVNPVISSVKGISEGDNPSPIVSDKDLLDMNITDTSTEKITENVDDIVQDLENLLGEPTTSFDFTIRSKDVKANTSNVGQSKDIAMELDEFSAELQMLHDKAVEPTKVDSKEASESVTQSEVDNKDSVDSATNDSAEFNAENNSESEFTDTTHISSTHPKPNATEDSSILESKPGEEKQENLDLEDKVSQVNNASKNVEDNEDRENISSKSDEEVTEKSNVNQVDDQQGISVLADHKTVDSEDSVKHIDGGQGISVLEDHKTVDSEDSVKHIDEGHINVSILEQRLDTNETTDLKEVQPIEEIKETESESKDCINVTIDKDDQITDVSEETMGNVEKKESCNEQENTEVKIQDSEVITEDIQTVQDSEVITEDIKTVQDSEVNNLAENKVDVSEFVVLPPGKSHEPKNEREDCDYQMTETPDNENKIGDKTLPLSTGDVTNLEVLEGLGDEPSVDEPVSDFVPETVTSNQNMSQPVYLDSEVVTSENTLNMVESEAMTLDNMVDETKSMKILSETTLPDNPSEITPTEILPETTPSEILSETTPLEKTNDTPSDSITEPMEIPSNALTEEIDILVQNTVADEPPSKEESQVPSSSVEEGAVSHLDVLKVISTLHDNKSNVLPEENIESSGALLASSTIEQSSESNMETVLPTVDEIFTESSQPQPEIQDDNLETLLAVASLQNVDYNMPPEDYKPKFVPEVTPEFTPFATKEQDERIESLFIEKGLSEQQNTETARQEDKLKEPLIINVDETDKHRVYSPKITIKAIKSPEETEEASVSAGELVEGSKGSLKMTITKQSDNTHSILKIYNPDDESQNHEEPTVPKLIIKPIVQPNEQPQSPKTSKTSKQVFSPSSNQRSASPRITIKPIPKPETPEPLAPLKITIKPVLKPDDIHRQKHSPKLTIKPIPKPDEECISEPRVHSPRVTIKPIVKPPEELEQLSSPRITIKPITEPIPRVTIKPVLKPQEKEEQVEKSSPKITIKPIVKPQEVEASDDYEESVKERIVLKINKGTLPGSSKDSKRRDASQEEEKLEKLTKIKLKFSKEGGHPHIVQDESHNKRVAEQVDYEKSKRQKIDTEMLPGLTITPITSQHSKLKEMLSRGGLSSDKVVTIDDDDDEVSIVEETSKPSPIVISEESNQDSNNTMMEVRDPMADIPVFEITPDSVKTLNPQPLLEGTATLPTPRKRGRPRKVPLQVREDFKDPKEDEPKPVIESTRPKRSCRGQSVRTTLGIKPRKPRGPGRGRGSKRGMGTRSTPTPPEMSPKAAKEPKLACAKEDLLLLSDKTEVKPIEIDDGFYKSPSQSLLAPPQDISTTDRADIVMYEEETRMSAETSSRAQTPAKQVVTSIPSVDLIEESQSSVQSTATTESVKVRRGPRLEVHQEPEGAVISADQLAEYYWSGGGPYMLQEQVAQFLGIKSFKRKYPNIQRRVVDMQERDFIRESGLASEAMCDLGLTAVNTADILDIMYSDFQDKYEEYCKHQRDRQAKDLTNKQRALSLAASQEKTKIDITQQAVQSAANWNSTFNKTRREQRKACMDLQTLTVHFPKGKMKQINKPKIGHYPVALVPGQFTDYYREFTPTEINNFPLNTVCYNAVIRGRHHEMECDSQTDGSGSESDTSTSDSDSSYSGSSDAEDCTLCKPTPKRLAAAM